MNRFVHFKLLIKILLKLQSSLFLIKANFFLPQIPQLDKSINLFCLVFPTLEFSFDTLGFHFYLQSANVFLTISFIVEILFIRVF